MNAGDTFFMFSGGARHLYAVISDPSKDDKILVVNFSTCKSDPDPACIVHPGDHPFVTHESYVYYAGMATASGKALDSVSSLKRNEPVSADLLKKIREGAMLSDFTEPEYRDILRDQGLV